MSSIKGIVINFHIAYTKEVLVKIHNINSKRDASPLTGKKAIWTDEKGLKYIGRVSGIHGRAGTITVKFSKPLPSKALGKIIEIP